MTPVIFVGGVRPSHNTSVMSQVLFLALGARSAPFFRTLFLSPVLVVLLSSIIALRASLLYSLHRHPDLLSSDLLSSVFVSPFLYQDPYISPVVSDQGRNGTARQQA